MLQTIATATATTTAKERVLLVDDEPQVLVALEDLLGDKFVVFKTASAEAALELMEREHDIAVVVTDQRMPRMNGDELLARLATSNDALRILVTGYADLSAVIRAVNDGRIFAYVTKPWDAADLRVKVDRAAEHFRLTKELAYERQLLHDLMNNMPDVIYFKDSDLRFLRVNQAFAKTVSEGDPENIVGKRLTDLDIEELGEEVEREELRVVNEGQPILDVVREVRMRGTRRWFSATKAPIRSPDGRILGLVGVSRDVTERVLAGEALRESEDRFREQSRILNSILDGMGEGVVATDQLGKFLVFNRRAQEILGKGPCAEPPADWAKTYGLYRTDKQALIGPEQNALLRAMAGEKSTETEMFVRNETVAGATVAVMATPLKDDANGLAGGIALLRDVTQQRQLEQQLIQSQKMDAIGRLAAGVAHDFNNLLAVITTYGELVLQELAKGDPKRDDLDELLAAAQRASSLTRQLLAFSRQQMVEPKTLQLNAIVSNVEKMLRRIIGEDIALQTSLSPLTGQLRADAGQLEQVILNLTVNARDAMPDGGKLSIETTNVFLDEEYAASHQNVTPGEFVMLAITDTGMGMDAETQRRIFEPFFTTKDIGKGTGLGLSTVYAIVSQSRGHIWVYSEVGQGTSFKIYFPRVDGRADVEPGRAPSVRPGPQSATILLVEDDDAVRRVAARILRKQGYTVLETHGPSEAREICAERGKEIDLLLTDVVMPETSGPDLAKELSALCPRMRVVFISGYPGSAGIHGGSLEASNAYLAKPFTVASLTDKVREALESA